MPTLKERVESIEEILEKLGLGPVDINLEETLEETIKKTIRAELEEAKKELTEMKEEYSRHISGIPEILDEICQTLENELGLNLVVLRKRIREL